MKFFDKLRNNAIIKASFIVTVITLLTKVIGYAEKVTVAYFWGTSYEADIYNAVFSIVISIMIFFREFLEPGMMNTLIKNRNTNNDDRRVYSSTFVFITVIGLIFCLCFLIFPEIITKLLLPGFTGEKNLLGIQFFRIASLAVLFSIITTATNTYLLSYKYFKLLSISEFIFKASILLCCLALYKVAGIYSLIWGLVFGAFMKLGIQLLKIRSFSKIPVERPNTDYIKAILIISWPLLIGNVFSQLSTVVDNIFASFLNEGSISALSYSKKIIDLPVILFPYTVSIVIFPFFTELSIEKSNIRLFRLLRDSLRIIVIFFVPLMIIIGLFPGNIISLIFERGAFNAESTRITSIALSIYNLGIVAFALETILVIFWFARGRIKTPVILGIICVTLNILITFLLIKPLGYVAIALSLVISKWLKVLVLMYITKIHRILFKDLLNFKIWLPVLLFSGFLVAFKYISQSLGISNLLIMGLLAVISTGFFVIYILLLKKNKVLNI